VPVTTRSASPAFEDLLGRLSHQSVEKHFDAYADVDWDAPDMRVDPADPRWRLEDSDPIARTAWYRAQPADVQARLGLHRVATTMRTGWEFENVLQRGLLTRAFWLPNRRPEFRYLHHEVVEESHHTMMFQELVNRSGLAVQGLPRHIKVAAELFVIPLARISPPLFFFFVLGGEDPIDHVQRRRLRTGIAHPLLERIIRIHVTEEARHLSFARHYLARELPGLHPLRRRALSLAVPVLLGVMVRLMLAPPPAFARANGIPPSAVRQAKRSPEHRALLAASVSKVRRLCGETGLLSPPARLVWRLMGIWGDPS
jgi:P-aminobenzoate N-oxygenase AurF